ncbi:STAS/SEC14 domain-containing protein [Chitinibacteraceae bacterium HSL-7]
MISISHEQGYMHVLVIGEFTLSDYREFEENVLYTVRFHGPANLLFDLTEMISCTVDMALEELRFSRDHRQDFGRVAVVTQDQWVGWSAWLNQLMTDAEVEVFTGLAQAQEWLLQGEAASASATS